MKAVKRIIVKADFRIKLPIASLKLYKNSRQRLIDLQ
jgi:hypothetical protein